MKILNQTSTKRFLLLVYHITKLKDLESQIIRLDQVLDVVPNFCQEKKRRKERRKIKL